MFLGLDSDAMRGSGRGGRAFLMTPNSSNSPMCLMPNWPTPVPVAELADAVVLDADAVALDAELADLADAVVLDADAAVLDACAGSTSRGSTSRGSTSRGSKKAGG